jgi:hypothetical protein
MFISADINLPFKSLSNLPMFNPTKYEAYLLTFKIEFLQHPSIAKPNLVILFKEKIAINSENHMKHANTLCGQNSELLNVKAGGT